MKTPSFVHLMGVLTFGIVPFVVWFYVRKNDPVLASHAFDGVLWNACLWAILIPCGMVCASALIGSVLFFSGKTDTVALVSSILQMVLFAVNLAFSLRAVSRIRLGRGRPYPLPPTKLYESLRKRAGLSVMVQENETAA